MTPSVHYRAICNSPKNINPFYLQFSHGLVCKDLILQTLTLGTLFIVKWIHIAHVSIVLYVKLAYYSFAMFTCDYSNYFSNPFSTH